MHSNIFYVHVCVHKLPFWVVCVMYLWVYVLCTYTKDTQDKWWNQQIHLYIHNYNIIGRNFKNLVSTKFALIKTDMLSHVNQRIRQSLYLIRRHCVFPKAFHLEGLEVCTTYASMLWMYWYNLQKYTLCFKHLTCILFHMENVYMLYIQKYENHLLRVFFQTRFLWVIFCIALVEFCLLDRQLYL